MGAITETSTWDSPVYLLETTDYNLAGEDGTLNIQAKQLANRTKWLKDTVTTAFNLAGIPTSALNPTYKGLSSLISDVQFETGVENGDAVYLKSTGIYDKAIADDTVASRYVGIADVTNSKVILLGLITLTVAGATPGADVYLSAVSAGDLTLSVTDICIGRYFINNIVFLTNAFGFFRGTFPSEAEAKIKRTALIYG